MSGTQPYRSEDEPSFEADDASRSLYGAPRATPRPGEETTETADDAPSPLGMVAPLSMEEDGPEEDLVELNDDEPSAPRAPLKLADEAEPKAPRTHLKLAGDEDPDASVAPGERESLGLGNRPAQGARVVSASEMFREGFLGQEGASDFLGLDTEFDPTPVGAGAAGHADESYGLREEPDYATVATEDEDGPFGSPLSAPAHDEVLAAESEMEDEYAYAEDGDLPGFESELADEEIVPRRSKRPLIAGLVLVGAAAAAAAFLLPGFLGGEDPQPIEVAARPETPRARPSQPVVVEQPEPRPIEDFVPRPDGEPLETPMELARIDPPILETEAPSGEPLADETTYEVEPASEIAQVQEPSEDTLTLERILTLSARRESFVGQNASMLDLVWRGETVPIEAVASPSRILTPAVGNVRVTMDSADAFEGRLFAVGEDKVWLDLQLGRIGLDGTSVVSIQRLVGQPAKSGQAEPVTSGDYVRAQVPGGVIYGRVKSTKGTLVTLVTESGARITLDDPVLEPTGSGRMVAIKH